MPRKEVPGHFRKPKRDRLAGQEVLAVEEGTSAAAAEVATERKDCFVDLTQPVLPYPDLLEGVVAAAAVQRMGRTVQEQELRKQERHRMGHLLPALVPEEPRHMDWAVPVRSVAMG